MTDNVVTLYLKHDDRTFISFNGVERDSDYLPYVNAVLGGDDTSLEIDNETGRIIGWTPIRVEDGKFVERDR